MTYEKWIELLVPIIGIIVAAVSAGLTYLFAKKKQILADECRLKEKYYLNYIEAVSNIVVSNHTSYRKSTEEIVDYARSDEEKRRGNRDSSH